MAKMFVETTGVSADREKLITTVSGARAGMVGGHMKSAAPIDGDPTLHFTGADTEYGKYVFNDIAEDDGMVVKYIDKETGNYRRAVFPRYAKRSDNKPLQYFIFIRRNESTAGTHHKPVIDLIETSGYTHHDNIFTSEKRPSSKLRALIRGETNVVEKDDVLTEMDCVKDGEFVDGVQLTTVTIHHPDMIEDAYTISETACDKMHSYGYREIVMNLRENEFLLDTYGVTDATGKRHPQYFPAVGQAIRDDGLVIASREHDPLYAALDMSLGELSHASPYYDHCEYVDADPLHYQNPTEDNGSRVIDIQVWRDESSIHNGKNNINCTEENKAILDEYAQGLKSFYNELVRFFFAVKDDVVWGPKACVLLEEAFASETYEVYREYQKEIRAVIDAAVKRGEYERSQIDNRLLSRLSSPTQRSLRDPISTYTIKIVVRYPIPVTVSSKITDRSGTKGIVGAVEKDVNMPIDEFGRRIHVMRSANAVPRRSTYAGLYQIFWSDASEQLKMKLKPMLDAGEIDEPFELLLDYLARYNLDWANCILQTHETEAEKRDLFKEIYDFSIRIWLPHELEQTPPEICANLKEFTPVKSRILLTNYQGEKEWSKVKFYVGYVETLRLDKTGREFSSISSMYTNYLGMIDGSNGGRGGYPINNTAKKWGGEAEHRLLDGYGDGLFDEIHNRANSVDVHRELVRQQYLSHTPSNPGDLIDRNKFPLGTSQVDKMIRNIHRCEGFELIRPKREDAE